MYDYNDFIVPSTEEIADSSSSNFPFYVSELQSNEFTTACNQAHFTGMKSEVVNGEEDYGYSPNLFRQSCNKGSNLFQRSELYEYSTVPSSCLRKSYPEVLNSLLAVQPTRKAFTTAPDGYIQTDRCIVEETNKIIRYSAEERKERIEKYRSKRNHRNFNKKITYACRKTLADSRPRIRGRFAKIEDARDTSQCRTQWSPMEEDEHDEDAWLNFLRPSYMS